MILTKLICFGAAFAKEPNERSISIILWMASYVYRSTVSIGSYTVEHALVCTENTWYAVMAYHTMLLVVASRDEALCHPIVLPTR